ncbi:MAG: vWA domain-containing protein [Betaproteobacteria bacterium]
MSLLLAADTSLPGHLADNVVHFARVLRRAGVPVGTDRVLLALDAMKVAGVASRTDLYATLHCCLIDRAEHRLLFDQAFHIFWKDPDLLGQMMRMLLPQVSEKQGAHLANKPPPPPENRRLGEALAGELKREAAPEQQRIEIDAQLTWSDREQLRKADFDTMTAAEWERAQRLLADLEPFFAQLATRRHAPAQRGSRLDLRALLRQAARRGGDFADLPRRQRRTRPEPLVVLLDISGSMSRYSRMFLHFVHGIAGGRRAADHRVHAFVFGTRLTNITRALRAQDPDSAIRDVVSRVDDWSGGTRIALALAEFNKRWARRVLAGSPTVLLVTDGLEHAELQDLAQQTERLSKSCRRLVWLNPLLRYDAFEPKARGIKAMLPHVDAFLPVHNVESLEQLTRVLLLRTATRQPTPWHRRMNAARSLVSATLDPDR